MLNDFLYTVKANVSMVAISVLDTRDDSASRSPGLVLMRFENGQGSEDAQWLRRNDRSRLCRLDGGRPEERARRALLRQAMEKQGFQVNPKEWWHFDYKDWKQYPVFNVKFEDLG